MILVNKISSQERIKYHCSQVGWLFGSNPICHLRLKIPQDWISQYLLVTTPAQEEKCHFGHWLLKSYLSLQAFI